MSDLIFTEQDGTAVKFTVQPCDNPRGWHSVGRVAKGRHHGIWVPRHHWSHIELAELHAQLLNRGIDDDEATATVRALCDRPATP